MFVRFVNFADDYDDDDDDDEASVPRLRFTGGGGGRHQTVACRWQ